MIVAVVFVIQIIAKKPEEIRGFKGLLFTAFFSGFVLTELIDSEILSWFGIVILTAFVGQYSLLRFLWRRGVLFTAFVNFCPG